MAEISSLSLYTSSGQSFTQRGRPSRAGASYARDKVNDFQGAIEDMAALSQRLAVVGRDAVIELADTLTDRTKEAIRRHMPEGGWRPKDQRSTGEPFEFSKGRIAAAFGRYTPEDMRGTVSDVDGTTPIQLLHEMWARENGVAGPGTGEGSDIGEETEVTMGAFTEIKRSKASIWTAEVGTFLPYAGLANDGGTMWIRPYGNPDADAVEAHWEGVHFIEEGVAAAEAEVEGVVEGSIQAALDGLTGRRKVGKRA